MLVYILKSTACLAILFLFYKLFLEKENMHVFKRFYLLASLVIALTVPTIVFTEYVEVPAQNLTVTESQPITHTNEIINVPPALESDILDIAPILWTVYFLGLLFFGIKFLKNLFQILRRIRVNPKQRWERFTQVLLSEKIPPHTFFKYIFLNKKKLESNEIPKEVMLHEETHALQKHSWDVVFVELLQVLFWVNPVVFLVKKAIKLNHEFLADQAVLQNNIDKTTYQNTLLSYLSPDSQKKYQPELVNAINYSSIKKRFTVMKTHTSKKAVLLRSLLLLPLLAILLLGFSETKSIEVEATPPSITIRIDIKNNNEIWLKENPIKLENIASKILEITSTKESGAILKIEIATPEALQSKFLSQLNKELEKVKPTTINVFSEEYIMPESEYKEEIDVDSGTIKLTTNKMSLVSPFQNVTPKQIARYNALAKKYNAIPIDEREIPLSDLKILETVFRNMNEEQKGNAQPFPECLPKNSQDGASRKLMSEYNALAKKYNNMLSQSRSIQIKKKDVERLEHIYGLMSEKQKADAEPFPDFPPMPDPPAAPKAPKAAKAPKVKKGEKSNIPPPPPAPNLSNEEFAEQIIEETIAQQDPNDHPNNYIKGETNIIYLPPTPPEPQTPLDHAIEMAKQGATFYYKKKKITSDEAISILKKDKDLSLDISKKNNETPVVKIDTHF